MNGEHDARVIKTCYCYGFLAMWSNLSILLDLFLSYRPKLNSKSAKIIGSMCCFSENSYITFYP